MRFKDIIGRADVWMILMILMIGILTMGCSIKTATVRKTEDGIDFKMRRSGLLKYKDKDIEAEMDTRNPGLIDDIIKLYTIKTISNND